MTKYWEPKVYIPAEDKERVKALVAESGESFSTWVCMWIESQLDGGFVGEKQSYGTRGAGRRDKKN